MDYSVEQRDEQLLDTTANIRYHLYFERAEQHLVRIRMEVDTLGSDLLTLIAPSWIPGSYKLRDMVSNQGNHSVSDQDGEPLSWEWLAKDQLQVECRGSRTLVLEYLYYSNERTVRTMHITRNHAAVFPVNCMMYVEDRQPEIHHVHLHHDRSRWQKVSSALSPIKPTFDPLEPIILGALNYDVLADSPIEIGNHETREFVLHGARHELAIASHTPVDYDWLSRQIAVIVDTEARLFGGLPYDRYVFILHVAPGIGGGLEHARSSVNAVDPIAFKDKQRGLQMLALLCHEFFHTWNVKRIRPADLGPFDYRKEVFTSMLWLAEGVTSYYDDLIAYRCGFMSEAQYIAGLQSDHLGKLESIPGRKEMSVADSSFLAWIKLYIPSADANNRFPSYYLKGGVVALLLELYIINETNGTKRLDDAMRSMFSRYLANPSEGMTEDECMEIIEESTGVAIRECLTEWLYGTQELPFELFETVGLEWKREVSIAQSGTFGEAIPYARAEVPIDSGMVLKEEGGKLTVANVWDESPAMRAGIGVDDEIISVNGKRTTTIGYFESLLAEKGAETESEVIAVCDGTIYQTRLLPDQKPQWFLRDVQTLSQRQIDLRNFWLAR